MVHRSREVVRCVTDEVYGENSGLLITVPEWQANSTNVDRSITALEALTVEVTKESYGGVVKSIEVINEPFLDTAKKGGATFDELGECGETVGRGRAVPC